MKTFIQYIEATGTKPTDVLSANRKVKTLKALIDKADADGKSKYTADVKKDLEKILSDVIKPENKPWTDKEIRAEIHKTGQRKVDSATIKMFRSRNDPDPHYKKQERFDRYYQWNKKLDGLIGIVKGMYRYSEQ